MKKTLFPAASIVKSPEVVETVLPSILTLSISALPLISTILAKVEIPDALVTFKLRSSVVSPSTLKWSSTITNPSSAVVPRRRSPVIPRIVLSSTSVPPATPSVAIPIPPIHAPDHSLSSRPKNASSLPLENNPVLI